MAFGTLCGLLAAAGYSAANACLRAVAHCDPIWVSAVKSVPTVLITAPFVALGLLRSEPLWPPRSTLVPLVLAALAGQLIGNVVFQWALSIVGVALAVPLCLITQIVGSALLGRFCLNESITPRMTLGVLILLAATCVYSLGAEQAQANVAKSMSNASRPLQAWQLPLGIIGVCLSGFAYAYLGVVIRRGARPNVPVSSILFIVCVVGTVSLGALSPLQIGWSGMTATNVNDLLMMLAAGCCNAVAFYALTRALQLIPVVYVNALGATQATLAAITGVVLFGEAPSPSLGIGVALSIAGILLMSRRSSHG